jgi:hypothetical protein
MLDTGIHNVCDAAHVDFVQLLFVCTGHMDIAREMKHIGAAAHRIVHGRRVADVAADDFFGVWLNERRVAALHHQPQVAVTIIVKMLDKHIANMASRSGHKYHMRIPILSRI